MNISVTATDSASASLAQVNARLRELLATQTQLAAYGPQLAASAAGLNAEIAKLRAAAETLSKVGSGLTLTPARGFSKMVTDLADVKTSFLSATASGEAFARELAHIDEAATLTRDRMYALSGATQRSVVTAVPAQSFFANMPAMRGGMNTEELAAQRIAIAEAIQSEQQLLQLQRDRKYALTGVREAQPGSAVRAVPAQQFFGQMPAMQGGTGMSKTESAALAAQFGIIETSTRGATRETANFNQMIRHTVAGFDEFARGQRGALFSTLGAAARDAGLGVNALIGSMGGLVAVMVAVGIAKHTETLGKWAQQSLNVAQATGVTVAQYTQLDGALRQLGGKQGDIDAPLRAFVKALEQAQDPASKAAQAFHAMGVEQSTISSTSLSVYDKLMLVVDAFNHANESGNKAAAQLRLFGNEGQKLSPLFDRGAEATRKLMEAAKELGITLSEGSARSMAEAGEKAEHLSLVLEGELDQAFVKAGPAIAHVTEVIGALGGAFSSILSKIDAAGEAIGSFVSRARAAEGVRLPGGAPGMEARGGGGIPGTEGRGPSAIQPGPIGLGDIISDVSVSQFQKQGASAGGKFDVGPIIGAATVIQQANEAVKKSVAEVAEAYKNAGATASQANLAMANAAVEGWEKQIEAAKEAGATPTELARLQLQLYSAQERASKAAISANATAARQSYEDFASAEREKIAAADGAADKIIAIYQEWLNKAKSVYHQLPAELSKVQAEMERAASHAIVQKVRLEVEGIDRAAALTRSQEEGAKLDAQVTRTMHPQASDMGGDIAASRTAMQQIITDGEAMDAALKKELATLEQQKQALINSGQAGTAAFKEVTAAIEELQQRLQTNANTTKQQWLETFNQIQEAAKKAAEESSKAFTQFFSEVGSQLDSFASAVGKALLFPQQELIKAGLTTIHVNLRGEEIRAAFQKLVEGMASDLFKGITNAISSAIAQSMGAAAGQSLSSFLGQKLASAVGISTAAPSATGMGANALTTGPLNTALTTAATNLTAFNSAVTSATGTLTGHSSATVANTASTTTNTVTTSGNTIASGSNTVAHGSNTVSATANTGATVLNTGATTTNTTAEATNSAASGSGGIMGILGRLIAMVVGSSATGSAVSSTTTATAITASTTAITAAIASSTSVLVGALSGLATILTTAIEQTGATTDVLLGAIAVKPEALGFSYAGGGVVSAAGGMVSGRAQLAILHNKEMVLPQHLSEGVQNMISKHGPEGSRSNSANLTYSPTINTGRSSMSRAELGSLLSSHSSTLIGEARNMIRRGWRP